MFIAQTFKEKTVKSRNTAIERNFILFPFIDSIHANIDILLKQNKFTFFIKQKKDALSASFNHIVSILYYS